MDPSYKFSMYLINDLIFKTINSLLIVITVCMKIL